MRTSNPHGAPDTERASLPKRATLLAATAVAPLSWGTTYAVTTELLPPGPLFTALLRSLPAGLLALAITRTPPRGAWWWKAAVLGALNIGAFFPFLFIAAERLPGGVAATLGAIQPLLVAGMGVVLLGERPAARHLGWGVLGAGGVGLVVLGPEARLDAVGVSAGLAGTAAMAAGVVLTKRWGRPPGVGALTLAGWQLSFGGVLLLPLVSIVEGVPSGIDLGATLGYLWLGGVGGLLAYVLWFRGVGRLPIGASAPLVLLSPLVAALGGLFLGETLGLSQILGFGLALIALLAAGLAPPATVKPGGGRAQPPPSPGVDGAWDGVRARAAGRRMPDDGEAKAARGGGRP